MPCRNRASRRAGARAPAGSAQTRPGRHRRRPPVDATASNSWIAARIGLTTGHPPPKPATALLIAPETLVPIVWSARKVTNAIRMRTSAYSTSAWPLSPALSASWVARPMLEITPPPFLRPVLLGRCRRLLRDVPPSPRRASTRGRRLALLCPPRLRAGDRSADRGELIAHGGAQVGQRQDADHGDERQDQRIFHERLALLAIAIRDPRLQSDDHPQHSLFTP